MTRSTREHSCGPYTLRDRIGSGGMGVVYAADGPDGEDVVVKVLRDAVVDQPAARLRLEREVEALRLVESPYVASVIDADISGERPYLVMERVAGESLDELVRTDGPLAELDLIRLAGGLASALAIIHAAGVVHRDLKPSNVLMSDDGPVIIDFGIAQLTDATRLTSTGSFVGTSGYAAPERYSDELPGVESDVFSWAATVAFAATGRPPFGSTSAESVMRAVLDGRADLAGLPRSLVHPVRAALARDPGRRPRAAALADRCARLERRTARRLMAWDAERPELEPPKRISLLMIALLAVPGIVAVIMQPYLAFPIAAGFALMIRCFWMGHRLAGRLWWLALPVTVPAAAAWTVVWPGSLAGGGAYIIAWLMADRVFPVTPEALSDLDVMVAGVWFSVITGGVIGNEIERVGSRLPHLGNVAVPRALAVMAAIMSLGALLIHVAFG